MKGSGSSGNQKGHRKVQQSIAGSINLTRIESDSIGSQALPAEALYGVQTSRAQANFQLSKKSLQDFPNLVVAMAMVKKSCALANYRMAGLEEIVALSIVAACDQIIDGKYHDSFIVDMIQGGAGTSSNMNINEVIANIVAVANRKSCGDYSICHPNNHVNLSQSTNDIYPTAVRLAILVGWNKLENELNSLIAVLRKKAEEFTHVIKLGRTQLQDAVPMTLGQEFNAFANLLESEKYALLYARNSLYAVNLGGTAIGSGINAKEGFGLNAIQILVEESGFPLYQTTDLFTASYDVGPLLNVSCVFKNLALKLSKIANDLRLLSMGPRGGISEIKLPSKQLGSSIMPSKINPVIPEAVSQVAYQIIGFDHSNSFAAESGQLQLNAMEPLIAFNLLQSIELLGDSMSMFNHLCIKEITANQERCGFLLESSIALATALSPIIGYENASRIAKQSLSSGVPVGQLAINEGLLSKSEIEDLMHQFETPNI